MLLKSIAYHDFRSFKGDQTIDLMSPDDNKDAKVTVILGNNTHGKTTFVLSFIWCLYGESKFARAKDILNKKVERVLGIGETAKAWVRIIFEDAGKEYTMHRVQEFKKTETGLKASISEAKLTYADSNGQIFRVGPEQYDISNTIKSILPQDLSTFFFFEGEKNNEIKKTDLRKAVRTLLGLEAYDNMRNHLHGNSQTGPSSKSVMGYYLEKQNDNSDGKAKEEWEHKTKAEGELEVINGRIEELDGEIAKYDDLIEEINAKLRAAEPAKELNKRRDTIATSIAMHEKDLEKKNKEFLQLFGKDALSLFVTPLLNKTDERLNKMNINDKGIKGIEAKAIKELLHRGKCLCGTDLSDGSLAYKNVEKYIDFVPPKSIGTIVRDLKETIAVTKINNKEFVEKFEAAYKDIQHTKEILRNFESEDRNIIAEIAQISNLDLDNLETDFRRYKGKIKELRDERDTQRDAKSRKESEIKTAVNNFNKYKGNSEVTKQYRIYYKYAEEIYNWVNNNYYERDKALREELSSNVSALFNNMYTGKRTVTIDDKYNISVTVNGDEVDLTGGLRVIQYFAYVGGLIKLAYEKMIESKKKNKEIRIMLGEQYPLVLDAAFSHADDEHTHNIARELSNATNQLVFALMEKDWRYAKNGVQEHVGRMYELIKIDEEEVQVKEYGRAV